MRGVRGSYLSSPIQEPLRRVRRHWR